MPNMVNEIIVRQLSDEFARAEGMVIVSLNGLSVEQTEDLRNALATHGVRLRMVRSRLARLALKNRGLDASEELFAGSVACAWGSSEDAVSIAKVVKGVARGLDPKKSAKVTFKGGFFEGNLLDAKSAAALAELPGKNELRAMMLGLLSGPARGLAVLLQSGPSGLARVMQARIDKGDGGSAAEPAEPAAPAPDA